MASAASGRSSGRSFPGAVNDNLFKNALVILLSPIRGAQLAGGVDSNVLINLAAGLFVLPFFLFSATAGQLADKLEKSRLIRIIKLLEIVIMVLAAVALILGNVWLLLTVLFLLGTQSTLFGPVKYAILPQHLGPSELVGGNGLVEMGTFVAILLGTIAGGLLVAVGDRGPWCWRADASIVIAIAGWLLSRRIPLTPAVDPGLKINWNPFTETLDWWVSCAGRPPSGCRCSASRGSGSTARSTSPSSPTSRS